MVTAKVAWVLVATTLLGPQLCSGLYLGLLRCLVPTNLPDIAGLASAYRRLEFVCPSEGHLLIILQIESSCSFIQLDFCEDG